MRFRLRGLPSTGTAFRIPMRGYEVRDWRYVVRIQVVPNPHEGL